MALVNKKNPAPPLNNVRRPKRAHHAHHGGAWKVAYADFVTAMMAFFLVMWLVGQSKEVKASVAGYFRDPGAFETTRAGGSGVLDGGRSPNVDGMSDGQQSTQQSSEQRALAEAAERIKAELLAAKNLAGLRDQIEFKLTSEGLRIDLVDRSGSSFFDSGSSVLRGEAASILAVIAQEIGRLQNDVVVEGHTDSAPYGAGVSYGNWELSADRANAARREMERTGMGAGQVQAVRGFADTQLHIPKAPLDPRNRRVSIVVRTRAAAALDAGVRLGLGKSAEQQKH
jgi:chemotaxis protein MotB